MLFVMYNHLLKLILCLAKTREREGKRKDTIFPFTCLVCMGEMEGNILVGPTIKTLSFFSQFARKEYGGPWRKMDPHFPFLQPIHPTKQRNLFPFSPFLSFSSPFPQTKHSLKFHSMHKIEQSKIHCINIKFCSTIFFFFLNFFLMFMKYKSVAKSYGLNTCRISGACINSMSQKRLLG